MSWVKGDRLKVTLEVTALEPYDKEVNDVWYKSGRGRDYLDADAIFEAGGSVAVEVIPKPVELPTGKWASVLLNFWGEKYPALFDGQGEWTDKSGVPLPESVIRHNYVCTLSEGIDE